MICSTRQILILKLKITKGRLATIPLKKMIEYKAWIGKSNAVVSKLYQLENPGIAKVAKSHTESYKEVAFAITRHI